MSSTAFPLPRGSAKRRVVGIDRGALAYVDA